MDCLGRSRKEYMGSDAEPEAMAGCIIYGNRHMTFGSRARYIDLDGSQPDAWRYLLEAQTDNSSDVVADHR
jgi:hypothetical protein